MDELDTNIIISVIATLSYVEYYGGGEPFSKKLKATGYPNVVAATLAKTALKMIKSS